MEVQTRMLADVISLVAGRQIAGGGLSLQCGMEANKDKEHMALQQK